MFDVVAAVANLACPRSSNKLQLAGRGFHLPMDLEDAFVIMKLQKLKHQLFIAIMICKRAKITNYALQPRDAIAFGILIFCAEFYFHFCPNFALLTLNSANMRPEN